MRSPKKYVESQDAKRMLELAMFYTRMGHEKLKTELCEKLKQARQFQTASRNGAYDYLNSRPCGYQDAFGDKVDRLFREVRAMKIAYRFNNDDASDLYSIVLTMVGDV